MPRLINRIVTLLLVPCFLADPSNAAAFTSPATSHSVSNAQIFQAQAMSLVSQWIGVTFFRRLTGAGRKSWIWKPSRLEEYQWAMEAKWQTAWNLRRRPITDRDLVNVRNLYGDAGRSHRLQGVAVLAYPPPEVLDALFPDYQNFIASLPDALLFRLSMVKKPFMHVTFGFRPTKAPLTAEEKASLIQSLASAAEHHKPIPMEIGLEDFFRQPGAEHVITTDLDFATEEDLDQADAFVGEITEPLHAESFRRRLFHLSWAYIRSELSEPEISNLMNRLEDYREATKRARGAKPLKFTLQDFYLVEIDTVKNVNVLAKFSLGLPKALQNPPISEASRDLQWDTEDAEQIAATFKKADPFSAALDWHESLADGYREVVSEVRPGRYPHTLQTLFYLQHQEVRPPASFLAELSVIVWNQLDLGDPETILLQKMCTLLVGNYLSGEGQMNNWETFRVMGPAPSLLHEVVPVVLNRLPQAEIGHIGRHLLELWPEFALRWLAVAVHKGPRLSLTHYPFSLIFGSKYVAWHDVFFSPPWETYVFWTLPFSGTHPHLYLAAIGSILLILHVLQEEWATAGLARFRYIGFLIGIVELDVLYVLVHYLAVHFGLANPQLLASLTVGAAHMVYNYIGIKTGWWRPLSLIRNGRESDSPDESESTQDIAQKLVGSSDAEKIARGIEMLLELSQSMQGPEADKFRAAARNMLTLIAHKSQGGASRAALEDFYRFLNQMRDSPDTPLQFMEKDAWFRVAAKRKYASGADTLILKLWRCIKQSGVNSLNDVLALGYEIYLSKGLLPREPTSRKVKPAESKSALPTPIRFPKPPAPRPAPPQPPPSGQTPKLATVVPIEAPVPPPAPPKPATPRPIGPAIPLSLQLLDDEINSIGRVYGDYLKSMQAIAPDAKLFSRDEVNRLIQESNSERSRIDVEVKQYQNGPEEYLELAENELLVGINKLEQQIKDFRENLKRDEDLVKAQANAEGARNALGVGDNAGWLVIKSLYRSSSLLHHDDVRQDIGAAKGKFQTIDEAYKVLELLHKNKELPDVTEAEYGARKRLIKLFSRFQPEDAASVLPTLQSMFADLRDHGFLAEDPETPVLIQPHLGQIIEGIRRSPELRALVTRVKDYENKYDLKNALHRGGRWNTSHSALIQEILTPSESAISQISPTPGLESFNSVVSKLQPWVPPEAILEYGLTHYSPKDSEGDPIYLRDLLYLAAHYEPRYGDADGPLLLSDGGLPNYSGSRIAYASSHMKHDHRRDRPWREHSESLDRLTDQGRFNFKDDAAANHPDPIVAAPAEPAVNEEIPDFDSLNKVAEPRVLDRLPPVFKPRASRLEAYDEVYLKRLTNTGVRIDVTDLDGSHWTGQMLKVKATLAKATDTPVFVPDDREPMHLDQIAKYVVLESQETLTDDEREFEESDLAAALSFATGLSQKNVTVVVRAGLRKVAGKKPALDMDPFLAEVKLKLRTFMPRVNVAECVRYSKRPMALEFLLIGRRYVTSVVLKKGGRDAWILNSVKQQSAGSTPKDLKDIAFLPEPDVTKDPFETDGQVIRLKERSKDPDKFLAHKQKRIARNRRRWEGKKEEYDSSFNPSRFTGANTPAPTSRIVRSPDLLPRLSEAEANSMVVEFKGRNRTTPPSQPGYENIRKIFVDYMTSLEPFLTREAEQTLFFSGWSLADVIAARQYGRYRLQSPRSWNLLSIIVDRVNNLEGSKFEDFSAQTSGIISDLAFIPLSFSERAILVKHIVEEMFGYFHSRRRYQVEPRVEEPLSNIIQKLFPGHGTHEQDLAQAA